MSSEKILLENKQTVYRDYDPTFTADISKKMQLPERLVAVNGYFDNPDVPFQSHYSSLKSSQLNLPFPHALFDEPHYTLATPPSSITNFSGTTLADEDGSDSEIEKLKRSLGRVAQHKSHKRISFSEKSHVNRGEGGTDDDNDEDGDESSIPMTPGTMLMLQSGDGVAALQRQIGKLNHRVVRLQEENKRRKNRELVFYPLIIGYLIFQLGRFVFRHQ